MEMTLWNFKNLGKVRVAEMPLIVYLTNYRVRTKSDFVYLMIVFSKFQVASMIDFVTAQSELFSLFASPII
jgi:hypothetical protein